MYQCMHSSPSHICKVSAVNLSKSSMYSSHLVPEAQSSQENIRSQVITTTKSSQPRSIHASTATKSTTTCRTTTTTTTARHRNTTSVCRRRIKLLHVPPSKLVSTSMSIDRTSSFSNLPVRVLDQCWSPTSLLVSADGALERGVQVADFLQRGKNQTAELLEMANQEKYEELPVLGDVFNAWMAERRVGGTEDGLI
jgi:hypothetical protein